MGLDPAKTAMALGIAATQAGGLKSMFGTMCKLLHAGKAAENGLLAAQLRRARLHQPRRRDRSARRASPRRTEPDFHPDLAIADPLGGFYIRGNLFKYHAACYLTHAAIECARQIAARPGFAADKVRSISLAIDRGADLVCNILVPRTGLEAKFSLRFTVARWRSRASIRRASAPIARRARRSRGSSRCATRSRSASSAAGPARNRS